ncbi:MAG: TolC family outer membrane protein [Paucibacter sp.]|nr:TolC family outer membrane protein [Roseateles sp.]
MSESRALRLGQLAAALAFAFAGTAKAQSLQDVYEAARAYDASYLSARSLADTAESKLEQAESLARPSLGLGASAQYQTSSVPAGTYPVNRLNQTTTQAGLNGRMALYNPANSASIEQARRSLGVYASDLETAEQDLIVRVAQAYFDVLGAQDNLSTAQAAKKAIAEQLASAKRNFEVGTATITDTREAQARFDLSTAQEIAADNDLRTKQVVLDTLVGRKGVAPKPLLQPVALPALPNDDIEGWVSGTEEHPLVRKARLGLEIASLEYKKARAANSVTVDATGTVGVQHATNNLPSPLSASLGAGTANSATLGLSINYPLYSGGAISGREKETAKLEEKAREDLEYARRTVTQTTRSAFLGVQSLRAQVLALEAAESSSKLALEATQLGYKVGVRVNIDVLNAQTQLYTTQRDLAKARYDTLLTGLRLRQANGSLRADDVAAVNQLLAK